MDKTSFLSFTIGIALFTTLWTTAVLKTIVNSFNSTIGRYNIVGVVDNSVTAQFVYVDSKDNAVSRDWVVRLNNNHIYKCMSTQCSQLWVGDTVRLSCYIKWHLFSPDEEICHYGQLIKE